MKAGKFTNADLEKIAAILDCTVTHAQPVFKMNDTGEEIGNHTHPKKCIKKR
jgi:hypothetical protein